MIDSRRVTVFTKGRWEPAGSATASLGLEDVDGIRWNDGNKWDVKTKRPRLVKSSFGPVLALLTWPVSSRSWMEFSASDGNNGERST